MGLVRGQEGGSMTSYARTRKAARERYWTPERIDALKEWYQKPFTPRAECVVAAVAGIVVFLLFSVIGLSV